MAKRKGFVPPRRTARLIFEDEEYAGAEVICAFDLTFRDYFGYLLGVEAETREDLEEMLRRFGRDVLVSWNVFDGDGKSVPATGEGMLEIPMPFAATIINRWREAMATPAAPLDEPSPNGSTSGESNPES